MTEQFKAVPAWVKLAVAVLVTQLLFWKVIDPQLFFKPDTGGRVAIERLEVATIERPDAAAIAQAKFAQVEQPWSDCCSRGYRVLRYHFSLASLPREGFLASSVGIGDNLEIYVNGQLAYSEGRMDQDNPTYHGSRSRYFSFPSALFRTGANSIDVVLVRAKMPWFDSGPLHLGERARLFDGYEYRSWIINDLAKLSTGIGMVLALLALVIAIRTHDRAVAVWTALTAAAWVLWNTFYMWNDPPFSPGGRLLYYFTWTNLTPFCWLGLVLAWTGRHSWKIAAGLFAGFAGLMIAIGWLLWFGGDSGYDTASDVTNYGSLTVLAMTVLTFLWHFRRGADLRIAESAVLALCVSILACEFYWEVRWETVFGRIRIVSIPILLLFVIAFLARNVRLFQSSEQINNLLQVQLGERTAELETAHAREKELVRDQAHQHERQRIMRDVHDGLGSQLMSMLLAARRGVAKPAVVADGLQAVIDEMRLLIDSMDSVGESLRSALAMFRERVTARVQEAGIAFEWHDASDGKLPQLGPRDVLQVFRIMQEAVTNALKHSGATVLGVTLSPSPEPGHSLRIAIADNGGGLGKANPRGRGLDSMAARAEAIGAKLDVQSSAEGVQVLLDLPQR